MQSTLIEDDLPTLAGSPGLTQGAYGDAGNLELVAPAADGGFWVFWFNADPVEHRAGAAMRAWSGGLHVFGEHRVTAARIAQMQAGPRFLEALAVTDGELHRLHWTPSDGFVADGPVARSIATMSATVELGDELHVLGVQRNGTLVHLRGDACGYPEVQWRSSAVLGGARQVALGPDLGAAVLTGDGVKVLRYDGAWRHVRTIRGDWTDVALAGRTVLTLDAAGRFEGVRAHSITATATTLDGGRMDVVLASDGGLVHMHGRTDGDATTWSAPQTIRSCVWLAEGAPVHRR